MNSFRFLERGIAAEIERQIGVLEGGGAVDAGDAALRPGERPRSRRCARRRRRTTTATSPSPTCCRWSRRASWSRSCAATLPELPAARIERLVRDYGLPEGTAEPLGLNGALTAYYEDLAARTDDPRAAANWVMGELSAHLNATGLAPEESPVTPERLAGLVALVADGTLGSAGRQAGVRGARRAARTATRPSSSTRSAWARSPTRARSARWSTR